MLLSGENEKAHHTGLAVAVDMTDFVFQHNTVVMGDQSKCFASIYFNVPQGEAWPLAQSSTHNVWILDNVLCRQPTGDWGGQGTAGLQSYMKDPPPLDPRFRGNLMMVQGGDQSQTWPPLNGVTGSRFNFVDPAHEDYGLVPGKQTKFAGDLLPGVNMPALLEAIKNVNGPSPAVETRDKKGAVETH